MGGTFGIAHGQLTRTRNLTGGGVAPIIAKMSLKVRSLRQQAGEGPRFEVTFRGYDRNSVDEYLSRLHQMLLESEDQAEDAWQATVGRLGDKAAEFLVEMSHQVGGQVLDESRANAAQLLVQAEAEASELVRPAEEHADKLREQSETMLRGAEAARASAFEEAQAEAEHRFFDARRQLEALQETITSLMASRANIVNDLLGLRRYLATAESLHAGTSDREDHPGAIAPEVNARGHTTTDGGTWSTS